MSTKKRVQEDNEDRMFPPTHDQTLLAEIREALREIRDILDERLSAD